MFWVTRYPMISKIDLGRVGYQRKYWVAGQVWVPARHWALVQWMEGAKSTEVFDGFPSAQRTLSPNPNWKWLELWLRGFYLDHLQWTIPLPASCHFADTISKYFNHAFSSPIVSPLVIIFTKLNYEIIARYTFFRPFKTKFVSSHK